MKVLIAEDDGNLRAGLREILAREGYRVVEAANGSEALERFDEEHPDFVCLDIMMPDLNGYDVCRKIRSKNATVPIVFISAKSEEVDKVLGLELGADDYILKPFGVREVLARIRAITRRCLAQQSSDRETLAFEMHDLEVLPMELRARRDDVTIDLSLRDVKILQLLHRNQGQVVDRATLFDECWGLGHIPAGRSLDQQIAQLRKRVELDPKDPKIIHTVHGVGYRFE